MKLRRLSMKYLIQRLDKTIKSFTSFTRYSLIILVLLTMSCTDKKQTTEPVVIEPIIAEVPKPEPIKLSYSNSLDIMLVESSFQRAQRYIIERYLEKSIYNAVYWDSNNNTYYAVTNKFLFDRPIPVTNTNFVYTVDKSKQIEPVFYPDYQEIFPDTKAPLLYIGDLSSPFERVYLDPTNQVYYIKHIVTIDTSIYESRPGADNKLQTNNTPPVYPAMFTNIRTYDDGKTRIIPYLIYTNENKQEFILPFLNIFGEETYYPVTLYE